MLSAMIEKTENLQEKTHNMNRYRNCKKKSKWNARNKNSTAERIMWLVSKGTICDYSSSPIIRIVADVFITKNKLRIENHNTFNKSFM